MVTALTLLGVGWFAVGTILTYGTMQELYRPDRQPERQVRRRLALGRFQADAIADFFTTSLSFLMVFTAVELGWPYFLFATLREWRRES